MNLFSKPKIPAPEAPKALPQQDDEAARKARLKSYAALAQSGGRESTRLSNGSTSETRLGDYAQPAFTRGTAVIGG